MGLKTLPQTQQRIIRPCIVDKLAKTDVYIEDLLMATEGIEEHLQTLEELFQLFRQHNLQLNRDKCKFLQTSIEALGHEISEEGVQISRSKIKAIQDTPTPI
jgi:hypothetical protein